MQTTVIKGSDLSYAVEILITGGLVGVPTETVYGLACNGFDASAVAKIYELKNRPAVKPLSLLVSDIDMAASVCVDFPEAAQKLAKAFWPGPLTIVLNNRDNVPSIVTAGGNTIGVRCPDHLKTFELLRLSGVPAAAPSANITDAPSPKTAEEVLDYFDGKIPCIIDGGKCVLSIESTIVTLTAQTHEPYKIIRHGALPEEEIKRVLGL